MNFLSRIPVWGWFLFSVAYCYLIWNPWFSIYQLWQSEAALGSKFFITALVLSVGALYYTEGKKSISAWGLLIFAAVVASCSWLAWDHGIHGWGYVHLWGQWVMGFFLTLALQGSRIYRSITGRVAVTGDAEHDGPVEAHH